VRNPFRGRPEISRREAELLLDRASVNPSHRGLADLLSAAAGPALPHETKGERAAIRRFRQSYGASLRSRRRPARIGALVTAAAAAVLLGGTAYAAGSGHLPSSLQRTAHDWFSAVGVPAPSPASSPSPTRRPSPSPSPSPSSFVLRELCVAWQAFENDPHSGPLTEEEHHRLGEAAGSNGKKEIDTFCASLLSPAASPAAPSAGDPPHGPPGGPPGQNKPSKPVPGPKKSHK
jgi:hypothetical protein